MEDRLRVERRDRGDVRSPASTPRKGSRSAARPAVALCLAFLAACGGDDRPVGLPPAGGDLVGGLHMTITSASVTRDGRVTVRFALEDDDGNPVELSDLDRDPQFALARIATDPATRYTSYRSHILEVVDGRDYQLDDGTVLPPVLASAQQVTADRGGSTERLAPGLYRYAFGKALPAGFDRLATHTAGAYASRENRLFVANAVFDFVPAGGPPLVERNAVPREKCNGCHGTLEAHGGLRRETGLCVLCHTDQSTDPETGETLDFKVMIHRIHAGEDLDRLPYRIVGFRQSVDDYSTVAFPRGLRDCASCHETGSGIATWRSQPSRAACGSCHDDVDFATGAGHSDGIVQEDDVFCIGCHREASPAEFDLSVPGAHVLPYESSVNPRLELEITDVTGMAPGSQPSVRFTIADSSGPVDISALDRVAVVFGGPTSEYTQLISTDHRFTIQGSGATGTLTGGPGDYTFAPDGYTIPASASGTWSVGMEARTADIRAGDELVKFGANNPVVHVDLASGFLGGGSPVPRREVASDEKCDACHGDLRAHGDLRTEVEHCVICHNPWSTDELRRPGVDPVTSPPESVDFKLMIHRIHRGVDLENPYSVFGFGGTAQDFTDVRFPGDLSDCETCHSSRESYLLPPPAGARATVINVAGVPASGPAAVLTPTTAACTGCHDGDDTFSHTLQNSIISGPADWLEACSVCHDETSSVAVGRSHAGE